MKKPNFFIIGAPKCGTTSLSEYLRSHPNVFFSIPKELYFFAKDFPGFSKSIRNEKDYLKIFKKVRSNHIAIGEGSTLYLFSKVAVQEILKFNPNAKFIVMLRNPIDILFSLHNQLLSIRQETILSPQQAWHLQDIRQKDKKYLPPLCRDQKFLNYSGQCKLGEQIERLLKYAPKKNIKIIIYDDLVKDPHEVYNSTLDFLNLPSDDRKKFPKLNSKRTLVRPNINKIFSLIFTLNNLKHKLKLSKLNNRKLAMLIRKMNLRICFDHHKKNSLIDPDFIDELKFCFKGDIIKLSGLINRDLTNWLK